MNNTEPLILLALIAAVIFVASIVQLIEMGNDR